MNVAQLQCCTTPPVSTSKITMGGIPLYETAFLKASVKSATVGFNFDVPVASAIWWSASSLLPAELILTFSIPERP